MKQTGVGASIIEMDVGIDVAVDYCRYWVKSAYRSTNRMLYSRGSIVLAPPRCSIDLRSATRRNSQKFAQPPELQFAILHAAPGAAPLKYHIKRSRKDVEDFRRENFERTPYTES